MFAIIANIFRQWISKKGCILTNFLIFSQGYALAPGTEEAPVILYCLHAYPDNPDLNEKAFNALFTLATSAESRRKSEILSNNGVKCIVDGLWRHMEVPTVQEAGLFALWALAVSEESGTVSKGAKSITEGRALDATLISMQTHLHFPSIQYAGCGILSCLARAAKLAPIP